MTATWQFGWSAGFAIVLAWPASSSAAEFEGEKAIRDAASGLLPCFAPMPEGVRERFTSAFLKDLAAAQKPVDVMEVFRSLHQDYGRTTEFRLISMTAPYTAEVEFIFAKDVRVPTRLVVEPRPPHRIAGLHFRKHETLADVLKDLKALPGQVGFTFMELGPMPKAVWEHNGDMPLAIASSMKLLILATLVDEINQQKRSWADVVPVRRAWASLPVGVVQDWPDGSPVTLHTLATFMVSRSDNTAADHLLRVLGREKVEAMLEKLKLPAAPRNSPFLCTAEMFKIKLALSAKSQQEYAAANPEQRRKLLDTTVAATSLQGHRDLGAPVLISEVEWFFSPSEMCHVLDWLRQQGPEVRELLAINRGIALDEAHWTYVGFKGGMEVGVLNFSVLLKDRHGRWFAFVIGWNDPNADVDRTQLVVLTQRLLHLATTPRKPDAPAKE